MKSRGVVGAQRRLDCIQRETRFPSSSSFFLLRLSLLVHRRFDAARRKVSTIANRVATLFGIVGGVGERAEQIRRVARKRHQGSH